MTHEKPSTKIEHVKIRPLLRLKISETTVCCVSKLAGSKFSIAWNQHLTTEARRQDATCRNRWTFAGVAPPHCLRADGNVKISIHLASPPWTQWLEQVKVNKVWLSKNAIKTPKHSSVPWISTSPSSTNHQTSWTCLKLPSMFGQTGQRGTS